MPKRNEETPHVSQGNVLDDLGFDTETNLELKIKSDLHLGILRLIRKRRYTPRELEQILDVQQSRVSELMRGKLSVMSLSKLAKYADKLHGHVEVKVSVTEKKAA